MADTLKPGDVVRLKSGRPAMAVGALKGTAVGAVWFEGSVAHKEDFLADTLELAKPSKRTTAKRKGA